MNPKINIRILIILLRGLDTPSEMTARVGRGYILEINCAKMTINNAAKATELPYLVDLW
jgi:hypothetical protein